MEDSAWLRKIDDASHINVAELESVIKGINTAVSWGITEIDVKTDSSTVYNWLRSLIVGDKRIKIRGLSETLVRRRLNLLRDLQNECNLRLNVLLVRSCENKADLLTRVPKKWLNQSASLGCFSRHSQREDIINEVHGIAHFGFEKTYYLAQRMHPSLQISRDEVRRVVASCPRCLSIDPSPVKWNRGELCVKKVWDRLACDVTHYGNQRYLTVIDCGPSRFTIWIRLSSESASEISNALERIFREHGLPTEVLVDNGASFRSAQFALMCRKWDVRIVFRCAYRPAGNGIVERVHRTIKSRAARSNSDVLDVVYWYNLLPKNSVDEKSAPATCCYTYRWRCPGVSSELTDYPRACGDRFVVGDRVFVKPPEARCTTRWPIGTVTSENAGINIEIDGIPRHAADVRAVPDANVQDADPPTVNDPPTIQDGSRRVRRPPVWLDDYVRY